MGRGEWMGRRVDTGPAALVASRPMRNCARFGSRSFVRASIWASVLTSLFAPGWGCRSSSPGAAPAPVAAQSVQPVPAAAPPSGTRSDAFVQCGDKRCSGATPQCCLVAYGDGTHDATCMEDAQMCQVDNDKANSRGMKGIRRLACDDSDDCGAGVCCYSAQEVLGDTMCADPNPHHSPCQEIEVCSLDHPCRASGADCHPSGDVSGVWSCVGSRRQVACGKDTCRGEAPLCCGDGRGGFRCANSQCAESQNPFWCTHPADCPGGQVCCLFNDVSGAPSSSACVGHCAGRNFTVGVCENDSHCDEETTCTKDKEPPHPGLPPSMRDLGICVTR